MGTILIEAERVAPEAYEPPADRLVSGHPHQKVRNFHSSEDGRFSAGLWECAPGAWRVAYGEHELCHILAGSVVLTGDDGSTAVYGAGDSFVIPAGFTGIWETVEPVRKLYAIYEP